MIFTQFDSTDIVSGRTNQVSSGLFTTGSIEVDPSLFSTSSIQARKVTGSSASDIKNGQYYTDVYYNNEVYFSIAYGDNTASGSSAFNAPTSSPVLYSEETKAIYAQYRNMLLQPGDTLFSFTTGSSTTSTIDSDAIFVINFAADKFKDQVDPGQLQLNISGANGQFSLIDDSSVVNKNSSVYNLISGSVISGVSTPYKLNGVVNYRGFGLFYPQNGVIVLNALAIDRIVGLGGIIINRQSTSNNASYTGQFLNAYRMWSWNLFNAIKRCTKTWKARKSEFVPSSNYFVRVKNRDYNYTNNPTFVSDGTDGLVKGTIIYQDLINNPKTYITSVGLYNDNNELLAIGKLSRPTQKSFDNELLIKVRVDF